MTWKEFYAQIKGNALESVYLFTGPEEYLKREAMQALRRALLPAGLEQLNEAVLEGATATQIIDAAETLPFMAERRIVEVRDWAPLLSGKARDEENEAARVLDAFPARSGTTTDALVHVAGLAPKTVVRALGTLQLAGRIKREGGQWKRRH